MKTANPIGTSIGFAQTKKMILTQTKAGLPNSCAACGVAIRDLWYAENEDAARSGRGYCEADAKTMSPEAFDAPFPSGAGIGDARATESDETSSNSFAATGIAESANGSPDARSKPRGKKKG